MTSKQSPETSGYLSDDRELQLRHRAPVPCRVCRHLVAKDSFVLNHPLLYCAVPGEGEQAEIVGRILMRLAEGGRCDEMNGF